MNAQCEHVLDFNQQSLKPCEICLRHILWLFLFTIYIGLNSFLGSGFNPSATLTSTHALALAFSQQRSSIQTG